jgi:cytochrome b6-f complex iron-sulfur subunit
MSKDDSKSRRGFLSSASRVAMATGLVGGYGSCAYIGARYVYPNAEGRVRLFVADVAGFDANSSLEYRIPNGASVTIARQGDTGDVSDFVALSSKCPHLGCQVHWQSVEARFFCPCHNGTFDAAGVPTGGPPLTGNTPLDRYPLVVEDGLLFIDLDAEELA